MLPQPEDVWFISQRRVVNSFGLTRIIQGSMSNKIHIAAVRNQRIGVKNIHTFWARFREKRRES
jgi:hypothetical protein